MTVARTLGERLRARHEARSSPMRLMNHATRDAVWWKPSSCWWWFHGGRPVKRNASAVDTWSLQAAIEELALLDVLARLDFGAFLEIAGPTRVNIDQAREPPRDEPHTVVVGLVYRISRVEDLAPIADCMYGTKMEPTQAFADDVAWLRKEIGVSSDFQVGPVPVQLRISVSREPLKILEQILHHVIQQHLELQAGASSRKGSSAVARIKIVEVSMLSDAQSEIMHVEVAVLPILQRLQELGVHIPRLPALQGDDESLAARRALAQSLRSLFFPNCLSTPTIEHVYVSKDTPEHLLIPLLSVIQASKGIKTVELQVETSAQDDYYDEDDEEQYDAELNRIEQDEQAMIRLASWFAYALFSRHADHGVGKVVVGNRFVTMQAVTTIKSVLRASKPFDAMFDGVDEDDRCVRATQFYMASPEEHETEATSGAIVFTTEVPLVVRVMRRRSHADSFWWEVLLPGCGVAWVRSADATVASRSPNRTAPLCLEFEHLSDRNLSAALDLVELVPELVRGLEIDAFNINDEEDDSATEDSDPTHFVQEVLRLCPNLERLKLPPHIKISDFAIFVNAAAATNLRLRELELQCWIDENDAGIGAFFDVLSDNTHPLTRHLEELHLRLDALESDVNASWERMLQQNRRLHTISVTVSKEATPDRNEDDVVLRRGPLDIASKLAFLSMLRDLESNSGHGAAGLDARVVGNVFEYAAPHRVRQIRVWCEDRY